MTADDPGEGGSPRRAVPSEKGGLRSGPPGDPSLGTARMGVGVGPAPQPWPDDPRLDPELLREGDRRNVVDRYRYWSVEAIRDDLAPTRSALHVAIENLEHDLNIGSIVRTANAFNVGGVHIVGRRRWNRRGALVTDRYIDVHHRPGVSDLAGLGAAGVHAAARTVRARLRPGIGGHIRRSSRGLPEGGAHRTVRFDPLHERRRSRGHRHALVDRPAPTASGAMTATSCNHRAIPIGTMQ